MRRPRNGAGRRGAVTVIATLPPPTTGMTRVTVRIVEELSRRGAVSVINLSEGEAARRRSWRMVRSIRQGRAALRVLLGGGGRGNVYVALNSGAAVMLDVLLVGAARVRGRRVFVHHHSFRFVDAPSPLLRALYRLGADYVVDIVLCERMAAGLRTAYGRTDCRIVPNLVEVAAKPGTPVRGDGPVRLGHLSNLSLEKGVGRAIEAFACARAAGLDVELHLAGPYSDTATRETVEGALASWPGAVVYHGALYGPDKDAFYASLDLFLYPTAYAVEAQPLVLLEALGAGVPVVSVDRGCVGGLAASATGTSVTIVALAEFSSVVADLVRRLDGCGERSAQRGTDAIATAEAFAHRAATAYAGLVEEILEPATSMSGGGRRATGGNRPSR